MKDYDMVEADLKSIADNFARPQGITSPFAKLKSTNFMTPDVVAIRRLKNGIWFELAYGTTINRNGWMYGVTFIKNNDMMYEESACCHTYDEVKQILAKISLLK